MSKLHDLAPQFTFTNPEISVSTIIQRTLAELNKFWVLLLCVTGLLLAGCSDKSKKTPKIRRIEGVATKIDLKNNSVAMIRKDDKGNEMTVEGTIRENTEVRINGRDQKLEDVQVGDKVIVSGYREGKGADQKLVATMIEVVRPREADWKSAPSQPAVTPQPPAKTEGNKP